MRWIVGGNLYYVIIIGDNIFSSNFPNTFPFSVDTAEARALSLRRSIVESFEQSKQRAFEFPR